MNWLPHLWTLSYAVLVFLVLGYAAYLYLNVSPVNDSLLYLLFAFGVVSSAAWLHSKKHRSKAKKALS
jgi:uncharacterized membrane protein (DUF4010 family)